MPCGCGKSNKGTALATCGISLPVIYLERSAMCRVCPHRESGSDPLGVCSLTGTGVGVYVTGGRVCPVGHHPSGSAGRLTWIGIKWRGVPYPVRLWYRLRHGTATAKWPRCGCIDRLKTLCERMGICGKGNA